MLSNRTLRISRISILSTLLLSMPLGFLASCAAPRAAGREAREAADARFRRTTSVVNFDQARQAFESGELDKARTSIEAAIARSDREAAYWSLLGRIELESRRLERALAAFGRSIECDPGFAEAYYYRGVLHQRWSQDDSAIEDYLTAHELAPERVAYLLAAAEMLVAERRLDEARMLLLQKLAYFEHSAAMHELLGDVASLEGDPAAAARSYERAAVIDPEAPLVGEKLVSAYFAAGEWQDCLDAARRQRAAAEADANGGLAAIPAEVHRHEGRALAMLGRHGQARDVFAGQVRVYPEDADAWRDLAVSSLAAGDPSRAEVAAERFVALRPDDAAGYTLRGLAALRHGRAEEAVRWQRLAVARAPQDAKVRVALGMALEAAGRRADASRAFAEAMRLDPDSEVARSAFAQVSPE